MYVEQIHYVHRFVFAFCFFVYLTLAFFVTLLYTIQLSVLLLLYTLRRTLVTQFCIFEVHGTLYHLAVLKLKVKNYKTLKSKKK